MWLLNKISMKMVDDLSIKKKLTLVIFLVVVGFSVFIFFNSHVARQNTVRLDEVERVLFPMLEKASEIVVDVNHLTEIFSNVVVMEEEELLDDATDIKEKTQATLKSLIVLDASLTQEVALISKEFDHYFQLAYAMSVMMLEGTPDFNKIKSSSKEMRIALTTLKKGLADFREKHYHHFTQTLKTAKKATNDLVKVGLILGFLLLVCVSAALFYISKKISTNLNSTIDSLQELCSGSADLTRRLDENSKDETGQVVMRFNAFLDKMQTLIAEVVLAAQQVGGNAEQLLTISKSTSENTKMQKDETDRLADAMTNMMVRVDNISNTIKQSTALTATSNVEAISGKETLENATLSINKLKNQIDNSTATVVSLQERIDNIGTVLDVIRSIAEKTNLLALNAAIEAARAGESGRGFAVVADEVRLLAGQTQDSTVEIQRIIEAVQEGSRSAVKEMEISGEQTNESVELIGQVNESLHSIAMSVSQIHEMGEAISSATDEQNAMVGEMHSNIEKIQTMSDRALSSSEITDFASVELAKLAEALVTLVGEFKVNCEDDTPALK